MSIDIVAIEEEPVQVAAAVDFGEEDIPLLTLDEARAMPLGSLVIWLSLGGVPTSCRLCAPFIPGEPPRGIPVGGLAPIPWHRGLEGRVFAMVHAPEIWWRWLALQARS